MANEIFISYKREDLEKVKAIKTELDEVLKGEHCWMDLDGIESGNRVSQDKINKAIEESTVFLFMMSKSSVVSDICLQELMKANQEYAKDGNKHLVLVKIDPDYEMIGMFKMMFGNRNIINFDDKNQHDKLIRDLRKWLLFSEDDDFPEMRKRVEELKYDYYLLLAKQEAIEIEIRDKQKLLGKTEIDCSVCGKKNDIDSRYCQQCGNILTFFPPHSFEENRLKLIRLNWKSNQEVGSYRSLLASLENEKKNKENQMKSKESLLQSKDTEIQNLCQQLEEEKKQSSSMQSSLERELKKSQTDYVTLKQKYDEESKAYSELKKKMEEIKEEEKKIKEEEKKIKEEEKEIKEEEKKIKEEEKKKKEEEKKKKEEKEAKRLAAEEEKKKYVKEFTVNGVSFNMIPVEGGTFQMGATSEQGSDAYSDEKPVHSVTLSDFMIGETEVTQELWKAVMGNNPSKFKGTKNPVECVSWNDCKVFIGKLNSLTGKDFRLPTEAEWEFAARGGNKSGLFKYSGSNEIDKVAWYQGNSNNTHPVGKKNANELGLYDMSGNVWEWCEDWYGDYSSSPQTNPKGPNDGSDRVIRGGSWSSFSAWYCRVPYRNNRTQDVRCNILGLRLAL